jgi:endogenous inhibitor of DNA gyrase (YacG/DUF329 family)
MLTVVLNIRNIIQGISMALCKNCGKEFVVHSSRHIYCSDYCRVAAHQIQKSVIKQLARINICKICGKEFNPHRSDASFCSSKCKQLAYRQRKNAIQKPFTLKVGKLHRKLLDLLDNIDIFGYHLADLVEGIPSNKDETCFMVTKTGEQLYLWDQPFPKNYSFAERYTQLSPDMMFRYMNSYILQYELRSGKAYTMNAILKREEECNNLKADNLKEL